MRVWGKFKKIGIFKYIGHLDLMRLFHRAFRRALVPVKLSEGYNPQPKFSIANPLALGMESTAEFFEMELAVPMEAKTLKEQINRCLPKEVQILQLGPAAAQESLTAIILWSEYQISFDWTESGHPSLADALQSFLAKDQIWLEKRKKKRGKSAKGLVETVQVDVRPFIGSAQLEAIGEIATMTVTLRSGNNQFLKPQDFIRLLDHDQDLHLDLSSVDYRRINQYLYEDKATIVILP